MTRLVGSLVAAAETRTGNLREDVRGNLVARFAADRCLQFKRADVSERTRLLDSWSRRKGQMKRCFSGAAVTYIERTHRSRRRVGNLSNLGRQYRRWEFLRAFR